MELEDEEDDIFIPANSVGTAMHQDKVRVLVKKKSGSGKRQEGTVVEILERGTTEVVGTFQRERDYGFVLCDNQKYAKDIISQLRIPRESAMATRSWQRSLIMAMRDISRKAGSRRIWEA